MKRGLLALVFMAAATVVLLADYAHVETGTPSTDLDISPTGNLNAITITAGNTYVVAWTVDNDGFADCGTPTASGDTFETTVGQAIGTSFRACLAVVCNATGGSTTVAIAHGTADSTAEAANVVEYSGVADSSCVADSAGNNTTGVDTITTDVVTAANSGDAIVGYISTNRNPAVAGTGSPTERWEASGTVVGTTNNLQDKSATGAGDFTLQWDLDVSGGLTYVVVVLDEDGGGAPASPLPALVRPRGGGGLPLLLSMTQHPFGARLVQQKAIRRAR